MHTKAGAHTLLHFLSHTGAAFQPEEGPFGTPRASISRGTQTDPISIRAEALLHPILRGLVSLAAMQFLTIFDRFHMFLSGSPALWALCCLTLAHCVCPVLRGVHFTLIWIGVVLHICSAIVAIITPDPM